MTHFRSSAIPRPVRARKLLLLLYFETRTIVLLCVGVSDNGRPAGAAVMCGGRGQSGNLSLEHAVLGVLTLLEA